MQQTTVIVPITKTRALYDLALTIVSGETQATIDQRETVARRAGASPEEIEAVIRHSKKS